MPVINFLNPSTRFYSGFINDDWKISGHSKAGEQQI